MGCGIMKDDLSRECPWSSCSPASLRRESDGSYWLVTPVERGRIDVDDVPFVVVELATVGSGSQRLIRVRSNLDDWVTIGPDHPLHLKKPPNELPTAAPIPYVEIRRGSMADC